MTKKPVTTSYLALAFFLITTMTAFSPAARANSSRDAGPVVRIASGRVRGASINGLEVFKGIPFAQPPVGKLRWQPPQPVKPWTGIRSALEYGHDCMQLPFPHDAAPLRTTPNEDCLYLNVWAPLHPAKKPLPVMVWIYGGGFVNGGSSPAPYSGAHFAHDGLIFVSFNYRLGRFGFFAFPALTKKGGLLGNYAFMDQIAALKWVQRNIAAFGGNPHEVTIFGESAGGMSVNFLLTSPLARGLFQRAMIESGGGRDSLMPPTPISHPGPHGQASAEQDGINFAQDMGIHGTGSAALAALRRLPAEKIVNGINMASMMQQRKTYSGPMIDGKVMVQSPEQVYKEGKEAKVPIVVGANSADLGFTMAKNFDQLFAPFGAHEAAAKKAFDPTGKGDFRQVAQHVAAVEMMIEPARFVARTFSRAGEPAYEYRFSYVAHALRSRMPGAMHSSEIPYVFDTIQDSMWGAFGKGITKEDLRVARETNEYWANFAKSGNPNGSDLPHWHRITANGNQLINFTLQGPKAETDPWMTQLNLVEAIQH
ncbi:MAG: carboxylesterase family protein [Acidobacteriota bacterium]